MFTKREFDIINLLIRGKTNKEIANELFISSHTVKAHLEHIYSKFGVHSRIGFIIKFSKNKIELSQ